MVLHIEDSCRTLMGTLSGSSNETAVTNLYDGRLSEISLLAELFQNRINRSVLLANLPKTPLLADPHHLQWHNNG